MAAARGGLDARPRPLGHGYATEAGRAALDLAWRHLDPEWICSLIHPDNVRSQAVAERLAGRVVERQTVRGSPAEIWRYDREVG